MVSAESSQAISVSAAASSCCWRRRAARTRARPSVTISNRKPTQTTTMTVTVWPPAASDAGDDADSSGPATSTWCRSTLACDAAGVGPLVAARAAAATTTCCGAADVGVAEAAAADVEASPAAAAAATAAAAEAAAEAADGGWSTVSVWTNSLLTKRPLTCEQTSLKARVR